MLVPSPLSHSIRSLVPTFKGDGEEDEDEEEENGEKMLEDYLKDTLETRILYLFDGQTSQYVNMGRSFFDSSPSFRTTILRVDGILKAEFSLSLLPHLYPPDTLTSPQMPRSSSSSSSSPFQPSSPIISSSPLSPNLSSSSSSLSSTNSHVSDISNQISPPSNRFNTLIDDSKDNLLSQLALFAVECALVSLWKERGVLPQAILGVNIGEVAAAVCAGKIIEEEFDSYLLFKNLPFPSRLLACPIGVLSVEDGVRVVVLCHRAVENAPNGKMVSVTATEEEVEKVIASIPKKEGDHISISVVNCFDQV
jgi:acyl transferase domain-containing protein